ncbi:hypothetical protein [Mucilaginibacter psychrotolerans]|uniref:Uncharacterized protein n=1 Tax=Mucilaginibacter psychrotolerans TaxID=1524096 RepID=A0A4Y8SGB6_9SPHI|nr:hypothetical protein [Mucilaginibacter psychrotolerans]TFF37690.1 hypothetical protein E2R66_11015 [Mucilaginibacter psychrotolerans]
MKNIIAKKINKKINKLHRFNDLIDGNSAETTVGDPTNTTITVLTTVSGQTHFGKPQREANIRF